MPLVLPPDLEFRALARILSAAGWREERSPGLLPPLRPGEPELAVFRRGPEVLHYSCNPALGLRVLDGPAPEGVPTLDAAEIARLVGSRDPAEILLGALAAAEAGRVELRDAVRASASRLPEALRPLALRAARRLDDRRAGS